MSTDQNGYNKGGLAAFTFSMVFTTLFFIYVSFFSGGVKIKEISDKAPSTGAPLAAQAVKKIDIAAIKEPWLVSEDLVTHGKQVYAINCAMCHGPEGKGDGPAGMSLNPRPRNIVEGKWTKGGSSLELFHTISHGIPGTSMAAFGHIAVGERWALVHYIHSITQNKVADDEAKLKATAPTLK